MAILNGTLVLLDVETGADGTALGQLDLQTEASLTLTQEEIEVTNKESGGFAAFIGGKRGGSISFTSYFDPEEATNKGLTDLVASFKLTESGFGDRLVSFSFGTASASTGFVIAGNGIIGSLDVSTNTEETVTLSGTINFSGSYTMSFS